MKEKTFISVVVYVHNSERTILSFLEKIHEFFSDTFESFEIILVNDASSDKTNSILLEQKEKYSGKITVVTTAWKHGCELSMLAGTNLAIGDFVYEIESTNLEFPIATLLTVYEKCGEGYDVVFASPKSKTSLLSKIFYKILRNFSYQKFNLETDSFKIITRRALNTALKSKEKNRYRKILYKSSGFPNTTIHFKPTKFIQSSQTLSEKISFAGETLLAFSNISLRFTFWLSILFFVGSVVIGIYAISIYLTDDEVALGWTTIMLFLSFSFSGIFLILTILGKYLMMIFNESKTSPSYVVQSIKRIR